MPGLNIAAARPSIEDPQLIKKELARNVEQTHQEIDGMVAEGDAYQEERLRRLVTLQLRYLMLTITNPELDELMKGRVKFDKSVQFLLAAADTC